MNRANEIIKQHSNANTCIADCQSNSLSMYCAPGITANIPNEPAAVVKPKAFAACSAGTTFATAPRTIT